MNPTPTADPAALERQVSQFRDQFARLEAEVARVIVGQRDIVRGVLAAVAAGGHVLLEGVPGLGKTQLVRAVAQATHLSFSRIQFTPDLMPADVLGTTVLVEGEGGRSLLTFQQGPIFAQVVLADEINRATPKTQSALLEAMQEQRVTVGGKTHVLDDPFVVMATQNPLEMEGTYPLPEAQVDRFLFKLVVDFPDLDDLTAISRRTTGEEVPQTRPVAGPAEVQALRQAVRALPVAPHVERYAARLVLASHPTKDGAPEQVRRYVRFGASPRGLQSLILGAKVAALLEGRYSASCGDVRRVARPALRHRLLLNFEGEAEGITSDALVDAVLGAVPEDER